MALIYCSFGLGLRAKEIASLKTSDVSQPQAARSLSINPNMLSLGIKEHEADESHWAWFKLLGCSAT
ncbi:hypothetical protein [Legionella londiniensis]|uniref:Uncharacterized protein n=1 Tax=Legionella londiniensis TaxID=45068 RepID=A0A0W0VI72_9GAMM|nr:hypothetical protein [Legionella londiniensis]KTD19809.1 hypothetical protein Llon_1981 [Legionella londiniensis]STX92280.1 Phage_integrase [Legionella londiniensis]